MRIRLSKVNGENRASSLNSVAQSLQHPLGTAPRAAVIEGRQLELNVESVECPNRTTLRAVILVDRGVAIHDKEALADEVAPH